MKATIIKGVQVVVKPGELRIEDRLLPLPAGIEEGQVIQMIELMGEAMEAEAIRLARNKIMKRMKEFVDTNLFDNRDFGEIQL